MTIRVENRTHRRLEIQMAAGIAVVSGFFGRFIRRPMIQCLIRDVSVQGLKLFVDRPIPEGVALKLWVTLPEDTKNEPLHLRGRVCWAAAQSGGGGYLAGIRLEAKPGRGVSVWQETIRERIRAQFRRAIPAEAAM